MLPFSKKFYKSLKILTFFLLMTLTIIGFGQTDTSTLSNNHSNTELQTNKPQTDEKALETEINRLRIENIDRQLNLKLETHEERLQIKVDQLESKINSYLIFGGAILTIAVFLANFFGRKLIKEKVENLVKNTASEYAKKATDDILNQYLSDGKIEKVIIEKGRPAIEEILKKLENEGKNTIDEIKNKGDKVLSSLLAKQEPNSILKNLESSDEEILKASEEARAGEFFDLALESTDPFVQIELYKNVLEIVPNYVEALNNIGVSFNNTYNHKKAIEYLKRCIKLEPDWALPYANIASSFNSQDDLEKALEYADKAIQLDPELDGAFAIKGNILTKKGLLDQAQETFDQAIRLNPKSPEAYFSRGFFHEEIKKYEESESDYLIAEKLGFSNKANLYNNIAVLYRRQKKYNKAIEYLNKARNENPNFPNIDGTLALIYADQENTELFYKHLVIALEKGCPAWNYLNDEGFDKYRDDQKLKKLLESYKKKYIS